MYYKVRYSCAMEFMERVRFSGVNESPHRILAVLGVYRDLKEPARDQYYDKAFALISYISNGISSDVIDEQGL